VRDYRHKKSNKIYHFLGYGIIVGVIHTISLYIHTIINDVDTAVKIYMITLVFTIICGIITSILLYALIFKILTTKSHMPG